MTSIKLSRQHPDVAKLIAKTYPDYKGRKVELREANDYHFQNYWDGGTRYYVEAMDLATGQVNPPIGTTTNPFNRESHATFNIPDGIALVEHIYFCGKDCGIRVNVNSNTYPKLLPQYS